MKDSSGKELSRRGFIAKVSQGFVAANVAGAFWKEAVTKEAAAPDSPGKKLGWAIVGLGNLAIHEILPAFAKCEQSSVTALVSGHPARPDPHRNDRPTRLAAGGCDPPLP